MALTATAGAAVVVFALAANLFPDWSWKILNTARNTKTTILGEKVPATDLSKYALPPGTAEEAEQVSCPSSPRNALYTLAVPTPSDESCSSRVGDLSFNNYAGVGNPVRGWIDCIDGHSLKGVRVDVLTSEGKPLSSTITNSEGRFIFPNLKPGNYHVSVNSKGLERVDANVTSNPGSQGTLCLVAAGTTSVR